MPRGFFGGLCHVETILPEDWERALIFGFLCAIDSVSLIGMRLAGMLWFSIGTALLFAECPTGNVAHFSCESVGGNTEITLRADTELLWDTFDVPAGGRLRIASEGGRYTSFHRVLGSGGANILGNIEADGGFFLVVEGIDIGAGAGISAPSLFLSSLRPVDPNVPLAEATLGVPSSLFPNTSIITRGRMEATEGGITLVGETVQQIGGSSIANHGVVRMIAMASGVFSLSSMDRFSGERIDEDRLSSLVTGGVVEGLYVDLYSQDFLTNAGLIDGGVVRVEAGRLIVNEAGNGARIQSKYFFPVPAKTDPGVFVDPSDGSNPGGISTTIGLPDMNGRSFAGPKSTRLLPTHFAPTPMNRSRLRSAVSKGDRKDLKEKGRPRGKRVTKAVSVRSKKRKTKSKKRSFFGAILNRK